MLLNGIRADVIPEIMAFSHHVLHIEMEVHLFVAAVEVMEQPQLFRGIHLREPCPQSGEPGGQLRAGSGEVGTGILDGLFAHRNGHIFFLHNAAAAGAFFHDHIVIFLTVIIQSIAPQLHENRILKIFPVQVPVIQGNLGGSTAVQTVDQCCIGQKQILLGFLRRHHVIDVREFEGLGIAVAHKENTVAPNPLNVDHILHPAGDTVAFPILPHNLFNCFHAAFLPPFRVLRWCLSSAHSRDCWA